MNLKILYKTIHEETEKPQIIVLLLPLLIFTLAVVLNYNIWLLILGLLFLIFAVYLFFSVIFGDVRDGYAKNITLRKYEKYFKDGKYIIKDLGSVYKGNIIRHFNIKNGKREGELLIYDLNKNLIRKEIYSNDKRVGKIVEFYNNKNKRMMYEINNKTYTFYNNDGRKIIFVENIEDIENSIWYLYDNNEQVNEKIYITDVTNLKASKFSIDFQGNETKMGDYIWQTNFGGYKAKYTIDKYLERLVHCKVIVYDGYMGPPSAPGTTTRSEDITSIKNINDLLHLNKI